MIAQFYTYLLLFYRIPFSIVTFVKVSLFRSSWQAQPYHTPQFDINRSFYDSEG